jgi:hypothetical protein
MRCLLSLPSLYSCCYGRSIITSSISSIFRSSIVRVLIPSSKISQTQFNIVYWLSLVFFELIKYYLTLLLALTRILIYSPVRSVASLPAASTSWEEAMSSAGRHSFRSAISTHTSFLHKIYTVATSHIHPVFIVPLSTKNIGKEQRKTLRNDHVCNPATLFR